MLRSDVFVFLWIGAGLEHQNMFGMYSCTDIINSFFLQEPITVFGLIVWTEVTSYQID